jgi:hypothetical protein
MRWQIGKSCKHYIDRQKPNDIVLGSEIYLVGQVWKALYGFHIIFITLDENRWWIRILFTSSSQKEVDFYWNSLFLIIVFWDLLPARFDQLICFQKISYYFLFSQLISCFFCTYVTRSGLGWNKTKTLNMVQKVHSRMAC